MNQALEQLKQDIKQFREELSWKRIKKLPSEPVELRSYTSLYLVFSFLLFLTTAFAVYDEFSDSNFMKDHPRREWREWLNSYKSIGLAITQFKKDKILSSFTKENKEEGNHIETLQRRFLVVHDSVISHPKYKTADKKFIEYFNKLRDEATHLSDLKAKDAQHYFFYTDALKKNDFNTSKMYKILIDAIADSIEISNKRIEDIRFKRDEQKEILKKLDEKYLTIQDEIDKINANLFLLSRDSALYASVKVEIKQVALNDFQLNNFYDLEMQVDRCQSCHISGNDSLFDVESPDSLRFKGEIAFKDPELNLPIYFQKIDYKEFAHMHWKFEPPLTVEEFYQLKPDERIIVLEGIVNKYKNKVRLPQPSEIDADGSDKLEIRMDPFQYHPQAILKVHDIDKMGCVSCHQGQGMAQDIGEAHSRHGEPGYDHYWEKPLLSQGYTQASCQSCHQSSVDLTYGEKVSLGRKLVMDLGCWGCHQVPMQEHFKLRKVGPQLNSLLAKTSPEFIYRWIKNPKNFYAHSRMPNFYLSDENAMAITSYLSNLSKSSVYKPEVYSGKGNPEKGRELLYQTGCTSCHSIEDVQWAKLSETPFLREGAGFAPNLNKIGSKANPDWIYDWLLNPKKYHPETRMPSLRLTNEEATDITAYLLTLKEKNPPVTIAGFAPTRLGDPQLIAHGSKLIEEKGCFGCHDLKEHNSFGNITVSLTEMADKNFHNMDFGNSIMGNVYHKDHSWEGWVKGKIRDPRQYSTDRIPLAMPNFGLNEKEIEAISVAIKGWSSHQIAKQYQPAHNSIRDAVEKGQFFFRDNNCIGCHKIENYPSGYIRDQISKGLIEGLDPLGFGNDIAYAPPVLVTPGQRYQEKFILQFLQDPTLGDNGIRPNFKLRMPSYQHDDETWNTVIKYFLAIDKMEFNLKDYPSAITTPEKLNTGKELVAKLDCQKCHSVGGEPQNIADSKYAPDLRLVSNKLKPDWTHKWLGDPQGFLPGTKMLPNWGNGYNKVDFPNPVSGMTVEQEARYQGEAVRDYIFTLKKGNKYHRP